MFMFLSIVVRRKPMSPINDAVSFVGPVVWAMVRPGSSNSSSSDHTVKPHDEPKLDMMFFGPVDRVCELILEVGRGTTVELPLIHHIVIGFSD